MDRTHTFARDETAPSWWANRIADVTSLLVSNFRLTLVGTTTVRVPGAAGAAAVVVVEGLWRWSEVNVDRAHPGGAAGTYDIFVTAKAQAVDDTPLVATDHSDYSFGLAILAAGATPPIVAGTVDVFRKVGSCQWDGAAITQVDPVVETPCDASPADGPATQASRRTLGTGARQAAAGNDARFSDSRAPTGAAGGDLAGSYPNPTVKGGVALSGSPTATTASPGDASSRIATTAYADAAVAAGVKRFQVAHTFAVMGPVIVPSGGVNTIPPFRVPIATGQTVKLARVEYRLNNAGSGTSVSFKVQRNGADVAGFGTTGVPLTTPSTATWSETDPVDVVLANNDELSIVVVGVAGTPQDFSASLVLEHTA